MQENKEEKRKKNGETEEEASSLADGIETLEIFCIGNNRTRCV